MLSKLSSSVLKTASSVVGKSSFPAALAGGFGRLRFSASEPAHASGSSETVKDYHCDVCGKTTAVPVCSDTSAGLIKLEAEYGATNYHSIPVVLNKASGACVWDVEGKHYLDFLAAYSAVNTGHGNEAIKAAMTEQMEKISLTSRAFYNSVYPKWTKLMHEVFGYERVLPANGGAEAVETALKMARKWGYVSKGIPEGEALLVSATGNFHGRTISIISMSLDPEAKSGFGPFLPGWRTVEYNNPESLRELFEKEGKNIAGFLVEPIQGEAGIQIPDLGYLKAVQDLCREFNVLLIADEIQTGLGRCGTLMAYQAEEGVRPDLVILGKSISGGFYPVSAVVGDARVVNQIRPGQHGSTYGGNAVGMAVSMAAIQYTLDHKLTENSERLGKVLREGLQERIGAYPWVKEIRGRGLFNAIDIDPSHLTDGKSAMDVCLIMAKHGLLAKPTHDTIIRFAPPLTINDAQMDAALNIIDAAFKEADSAKAADVPLKDLDAIAHPAAPAI